MGNEGKFNRRKKTSTRCLVDLHGRNSFDGGVVPISKSYHTNHHNQTLIYRSRFTVKTMSSRAEKAISSQRVSHFTNCADIAAPDYGNSMKLVQYAKSGQTELKKVFCVVTCIESNPYQRIKRMVSWEPRISWANLVFLWLWMIDAVHHQSKFRTATKVKNKIKVKVNIPN